MKNLKITAISFILVLIVSSCRKNEDPPDNYASLKDFYTQNASPTRIFTINGATGGYFTTPSGTSVSIPPHAFEFWNAVPPWHGSLADSTITVYFKDI